MDELRLAIPDESLLDEIAAYRQAMLNADSSMDGCGPLKRMENPAEWLAFCRQLDDPATTPPNWVPMTQFVCLRGEKIVGMIQVRRELNDFLREYAGHIGYSVRPDERQQGIATWMLHNVLTYCREIGLKRGWSPVNRGTWAAARQFCVTAASTRKRCMKTARISTWSITGFH